MIELAAAGIVLEVEETLAEVLCGELDDIRHDPGIEPEIAVMVNFEHGVKRGFRGDLSSGRHDVTTLRRRCFIFDVMTLRRDDEGDF